MREFMEYLLKQIVRDEQALQVEEIERPDNEITGQPEVDIKIHVADDDMGLVIGREGRTIRSIRSLAKSKAIKDNIRVNIELVEPERQPENPEQQEKPGDSVEEHA